MKTLQLHNVVILSAAHLDESVMNFFEKERVKVNVIDDANDSIFPIDEEVVAATLSIIAKRDNLPCLILCETGKNLTGLVVACLRKLQKWSYVSIFEEYRRYAGLSALQQQHEQFIEVFDTEMIQINHESAPDFIL